MSTCAIIVLAAGDGKRMKTGIPKVMNLLHDKPLVGHVVDAIEKTKLVDKPVVVVSAQHTLVQDYLGSRAEYVLQNQQLGTGHAVGMVEDTLKDKADTIVVLYGDMPFVTPESIQRLVLEHARARNVVTLMTTKVPDFGDWRAQFNDFGRVVRNASGAITKIVEKKDATPEEVAITEVNPSYLCFDAPWLWAHVKLIRNSNVQSEYYLIDLIGMAISEGSPLSTVPVDPREAIGINTKEHLENAQKM